MYRLLLAAIFFFAGEVCTSATPPLTPFPHIPQELREELTPYLLPEEHPIKEKLDRLFSSMRVTQSEKQFEKAGFGKPMLRDPTNIIVGEHPDFEGFLFKVYLDTQPSLEEWVLWRLRIEGALAIQECINRHRFEHFIVPNKWIYCLPPDPSPPEKERFNRKNFILIVEKINLLPGNKMKRAFKRNITPEFLQELYTLMSEEGLIDSVFPSNIPFTVDGKIAFIDTEHRYPGREVPYEKLLPYLSKKMQREWIALTGCSSIETGTEPVKN